MTKRLTSGYGRGVIFPIEVAGEAVELGVALMSLTPEAARRVIRAAVAMAKTESHAQEIASAD